MADGGTAASGLATLATQLVGLLVQYGLPALLVLVLLYVERRARLAAQEKRVHPWLGTAVFGATWVCIFALIGLVARQMIEDRERRTWVIHGRIFGIDPPLRIEVTDENTYSREVVMGGTPRHVEWIVITRYPLRDRCLLIRVVGADSLSGDQPGSRLLKAFALNVTSDRDVSLLYEPQKQRMTFTDRAAEPLPDTCGVSGPMPPQLARQQQP